jgi:glyoxylase-like metal-dependent hydrolase (beta-lactamase superfamily II)
MKIRSLLIGGIAAAALIPAMTLAQANSPARAAGPRNFAQWDKIEITVETKYGNNLAVLHGSPGLDTTHPDAAGGRVMALYGPDGVLMVDSQDEELTQKTIDTIHTLSREPIRILVTSHAHPDHSGGVALVQKQGAVLFGQEDLRREMMPAGSSAGSTSGPSAARKRRERVDRPTATCRRPLRPRSECCRRNSAARVSRAGFPAT